MEFVRVARSGQVPEGIVRRFYAGEHEFAVARLNGKAYATSNYCTHLDCLLSSGKLRDDGIGCSCHGSAFDLETGEPISPPATEPIQTFPVQERDGEIYETVGVTLPPAAIPPGTPVYQQQLVDFAAVGVIGAGANSLVYPMIRVSWSTPSDPTVAEIVVFWRAKDGPGPTFSRVIKVGTNIAVLTEGVVSETEYEVWHQLVADPARATSPTAPIGVTTPYAPSRDVEVTLGQLQTDVISEFYDKKWPHV